MNSIYSGAKMTLKDRRGLAVIILLNLAITIFLGLKLNVWIDEAYSLHTTSGDIGYAFSQAIKFESQAPLYFIILKLWRFIDPSPFFARLFSMICISCAIYLSAKLSARYIPRVRPVWFAVIIAFNPFTIWAAVEIRAYALIILITVLLLLFFFEGYLAESPRKFARYSYITLAVLGLYTQYYVGYLLFANAVLLLLYGKRRMLGTYIINMIVPLLSLTLILPEIFSQMSTHSKYKYVASSDLIYESFRFILLKCKDYIFAIDEYSIDFALRWLIRASFLVLLYFTIKNYMNRVFWLFVRNYRFLFSVVIVLIVFFSITYNLLGQFFLQDKHTAILFIPVLITAFGIISINPDKKITATWFGILLTLYAFTLWNNYSTLSKHANTALAAEFIMEKERENQPILVYRNELALPLVYHYSGLNDVFPLPHAINFDEPYDHNLWIINSYVELDSVISSIPRNPDYVWLVNTKTKSVYGVDYHNDILENYVKKNYTAQYDVSFRTDIRVRLLRKQHTRIANLTENY